MKVIGATSTKRQPIATLADWYAAVSAQKWETDYPTAQAKAATKGWIVLAACTGDPWCGPCKNLKAEVFQSWAFLSWAFGRAVLLSINDPAPATPQPAMFDQFNIFGVPTVIGLDAQGSELGRLVGYASGTGAKLWISAFESEIGWG